MGCAESSEAVSLNQIEQVKRLIAENKVMVFSKSYCGFCDQVKTMFRNNGITEYKAVEMDVIPGGGSMHASLKSMTKMNTVPSVWVNGKHIGGCDSTLGAARDGRLKKALD